MEHRGASDVDRSCTFQTGTTELTHAQLIRQEAKQRIKRAFVEMCREKSMMKTDTTTDQREAMEAECWQQDKSGLGASTLAGDRAWSPQQVEHVRQRTSQLLSASEAKLQCLVDCLQESSPAPVVIGAFLCSCQVSYM